MSYETVFSDYLSVSFDNIAACKEWYLFLSELHDAVEHQLAENNVDNFHNLVNHEQQLIIERAIQSLSGSVSYQVLQEKISQIVDYQVNNESGKIIRIDSNPYQTRTESILSAVFEGVISIINRWPILRNRLYVLINQNVPNNLRSYLWKVILMDDKILETYQRGMKMKAKGMISNFDKEISRETESLLNTETYVSDMKGSVGCFYGMKAVLSYYHATSGSNSKLATRDYLLMLPFVYAINEKLSRREPPPMKVMEVLVQEYFVFRHNISMDLGFVESYAGSLSEPNSQYRHFCQQVYRNLVNIDLGSAQALIDNLIPAQETIVTTEAKLFEIGADLIEHFLYPLISNLLIGFVSMDTLMFIFDQYFFGIDKGIYREKYWPVIIAIYIDLIVKKCRKNKSQYLKQNITEDIMRKEGVLLSITDFQYEINKTFYVELMKVMTNSSSGIDPIARHSKWKHWFDPIKHHGPITSADRLEMRILREEERKKFIEMEKELKKKEQENALLTKELSVRSKEFNATVADMKNGMKSKIDHLSQENSSLKTKNMEIEKELKTLLDQMDNHKSRESSRLTYRGLVPPPGTPGQISDGIPLPSPTPLEDDIPPEPVVEDEPLKKLAKDMSQELGIQFRSIIHGDGKEKFDLNDDTRTFIQMYNKERKAAEMNVFGRNLEKGELEQMDKQTDNFYSQKLWQIIADKENEAANNVQ